MSTGGTHPGQAREQALLRVAVVRLDRCLNPSGVTLEQSREDVPVGRGAKLAAQRRVSLGGRAEKQHGLAQHLLLSRGHTRVPGQLDEAAVEGEIVGRHLQVTGPAPPRPLHRVEVRPERQQPVVARAGRDDLGRTQLERLAHRVHLRKIAGGERRDDGAPARQLDDEALPGELPDRLAHGPAARAEPLGEVGLDKLRPGLEVAAEDRGSDPLGDRLPELRRPDVLDVQG